jgi:hypothetical protein
MMPKQALKALEREKGDLERLIPPLVNKYGVVEAGNKLKISAATVGKWLKDNNYTSITMWMKKTTPQERADIDAAAERVNIRRIEQGLPTLEEEEEFS